MQTQIRYKILILTLLFMPHLLTAQKMHVKTQSFSPQIQVVESEGLDFGSIIKGADDQSLIQLNEEQAAWVKITAPRFAELEIVFDLPSELTLAQHSIPSSIQASYANQNPTSLATAKANAVEIPEGFATMHIPVRYRNTGPPTPPLTPLTNSQATSDVYLFFYGTAGPASNDIQSGFYSGTIFITVSLRNL
jgi:hypothetical protein